MAVFESRRLFKLWSYTVSHRTMFLRSNPDPQQGETTRIEIYVGHVDLMMISSDLEGLRLWRASELERIDVNRKYGTDAKPNALYLLRSRNASGFIVSGRPQWREAACSIEDETLFKFGDPWNPDMYVSWGNVE